MALNDTAVSILHPPFPAATLTTTPSAGHCLSRVSWLRATPTRVYASHYSTCEGAGRKLPVWCGTPHLALVARIRLGSCTDGAHTFSGIAQCSAPKQRAVGARRASAGGRAHSVRSFPLYVSLCSSHCSVFPR